MQILKIILFIFIDLSFLVSEKSVVLRTCRMWKPPKNTFDYKNLLYYVLVRCTPQMHVSSFFFIFYYYCRLAVNERQNNLSLCQNSLFVYFEIWCISAFCVFFYFLCFTLVTTKKFFKNLVTEHVLLIRQCLC